MVQAVSPGDPRDSMRTCIGCRGRESRSSLLRIVAVDDGAGPTLVLDARRRLPGRGAWLHARVECVDQAVRRRAFARALRCVGPLGVDALREQVAALAPGGVEREQQDTGSAAVAAPAEENRKRV